jgi:choline dehydrogenase-like flavoprotein
VIGGCRFSTATTELGFGGPVAYARRAVAGWGLAHKHAMRAAMGHMLSVVAIGESLPNSDTYIDLDPVRRDEFHRPIPRIHAHLPESETDRLTFMARQCRAILAAAGVPELCEEFGSYDYFNATHVFGSCRMGSKDDTSVVDADGQAHAWRNLFIADASVFPSSGGGESPSLTIEALAIRSADRIADRLQRREL